MRRVSLEGDVIQEFGFRALCPDEFSHEGIGRKVEREVLIVLPPVWLR
jgi:hypothetical protein